MTRSAEQQNVIRQDIFRWLDQKLIEEGHFELTRTELEGYAYLGERIPLLDTGRGIRNPVDFDETLTIMTSSKKVSYDDEIQPDGLVRYSYRTGVGGDNIKLQKAAANGVPMVYLKGVRPGVFVAHYPAYIVRDDPVEEQVLVALDEAFRFFADPLSMTTDERRYANRIVRERLHQPMFRARVLRAYRGACAVCSLRHPQLLDAAHIVSDTGMRAISTAYLSAVGYNPIGQLTQLTRSSTTSSSTSYDYDPATTAVSGITETTLTGGVYTTTAASAYTRDLSGNILSASTTAAGVPTDTQCYTYDRLQNLTEAWTPSANSCATAPSSSTIGGAAPYWKSFTVNPITGNRTGTITKPTTPTGTASTYSYTYPAAATPRPHAVSTVTQATGPGAPSASTYGYDNAGNTTTRPSQTIEYNALGKETKVTTGSSTEKNVYAAEGSLLLRVDSTAGATLYLGSTELRIAAGAATASGVRTYSAAGTAIAERSTTAGVAGSVLKWLSADIINTAVLAVDAATGSLTRRYMDPYGNSRGAAPAWTSNHGYLNAPTSTTTGLTHLGAREYDTQLGRFTSLDPVLAPSNPKQNNGYSYAHNNPVSHADPTGLEPKDKNGNYDGNYYKGHGGAAPSTPPAAGNGTGQKPGAGSIFSPCKYSPCGVVPSEARRVSDYSYMMMSRWLASDKSLTLYQVGNNNRGLINDQISWALDAKEGNVWSGVLLAGSLSSYEGTQSAAALDLFYEQVKTRGEWDLKVGVLATYGLSGFEYAGEAGSTQIRADVFGNVVYGVMTDIYGITEENAVRASNAGLDATGKVDSNDDAAIRLGYRIFEKYPTGFSGQQLYDFILDNGPSNTVRVP